MQNMEMHKLINASALFRNLQADEAEAIMARLQPSHYESGALILERDVWHGRLYIIAAGLVSVLLQDDREREPEGQLHTGAPYVVAQLGPGECFGEMSLITGEPPTATIRAEQDTILWSLTQADFLLLMGSCPTLLCNINTILSQRLARTNQYLLSEHAAEILLLRLVDVPEVSPQLSLGYHIADALATRSRKRVLLLELAGRDQALYHHFAIHEGQLRSSLLACMRDHELLQAHHAPVHTKDGVPFPALAALTETYDQLLTSDTVLFHALADLALRYDYILLVATRETPTHLLDILMEKQSSAQPYSVKRAITLLSAEVVAQSPLAFPDRPSEHIEDAVCVSHVPGHSTIGVQDEYARKLGYPVTRLLPADDAALDACWQRKQTLREFAPDGALTRAVDFVARFIAHQTIGIAFGGGGARGFAHLGVLERLLAHKIPLDYIAACSVGIIAPGAYLMGKSVAESEAIFMQVQRQIAQWNFPRTSIFSNRGLKHMLRDLCGDTRFEDLETPFAIVAADLTTRSGVVLERGYIWQAGLASVALPGIFPPVVIGKHILVDAGFHDPVPIRLLRRMGADILLASELGGQEPPDLKSATPWLREEEVATPRPQRMPSIIDVLLRAYDLGMATIGMHSIREADIVFRPKLHRVSLRQFAEGRQFIDAGREVVEQEMAALRKRLPWL